MEPEFFATTPCDRIRVEHVSYAFEVHSETLAGLRVEAARDAAALFGDVKFRIVSMDVYPFLKATDGNEKVYAASVQAQSV